jgi:uncharacterized membrane protein
MVYRYVGYGMMNGNYGYYGMMGGNYIFYWIFMVLGIISLVLFIVWITKKIKEDDNKRFERR